MTSTLSELFPGNIGRVWLTRVAIRMRMPELMRMAPGEALEGSLLERVSATLVEVRRG